jgi:hypothetical protein
MRIPSFPSVQISFCSWGVGVGNWWEHVLNPGTVASFPRSVSRMGLSITVDCSEVRTAQKKVGAFSQEKLVPFSKNKWCLFTTSAQIRSMNSIWKVISTSVLTVYILLLLV